jgi:hypothetical protein
MAKIVLVLSTDPMIKTHKTTIYPSFYGCEPFKSLTLQEKHILKVYENKDVRRIFGPKTEEVMDGCG